MQKEQREVWMRGALPNIPPLLQPVAHALLQVAEDIALLLEEVDETKLWERPNQVASPAFHIQHIGGVIDRMFTYARQEALSEAQFAYLQQEGKYTAEITKTSLLRDVQAQIRRAVDELSSVREETLTEKRYLGRQQLPTTLIGLLFHAAEHSQRHVGQLLVTIRCL